MRIEFKKLMKLQVQTNSGAFLGKVKNIILETEGQSILQYEVGNYLGKKYLISREQVIGLDDKKMIVEDNIVNVETGPATSAGRLDLSGKKIKIGAEPEGAVMSE